MAGTVAHHEDDSSSRQIIFQSKSSFPPVNKPVSKYRFLIVGLTGLLLLLIFTIAIPVAVCFSGHSSCGRGADTSSEYASDLPSEGGSGNSTLQPQPTAAGSTNDLMLQGFEWYIPKDGKHWRRLATVLKSVGDIGVGNVWIPPPTKAATVNSLGYDAYDLWDLGEFSYHDRIATALGPKQDLLDLATQAHKVGVGLIVDAALNQRSGADVEITCSVSERNPSNRLQSISSIKDEKLWVGFNFSSRQGLYSSKTWGCDDFTAVDFDASTQSSGIFKIEGKDNDFATDTSSENGNFDVAYNNPSVRADVNAWGVWVANLLGARGFRIDAAKHLSRSFLKQWVSHIQTNSTLSNTQDMLFTAEYWSEDAASLLTYLDSLDADNVKVFDVPLVSKFHKYSTGEETDLRTMFNNTVSSVRPTNVVTFVTNHDTQPGQSEDASAVQEWFKPLAYGAILLREESTYPCIFYGDLFGVGSETGTLSGPAYAQSIAKAAVARTHFAYGDQQLYDVTLSGQSAIGWTRAGDSGHSNGTGLAVAMSIGSSSSSTASLSMHVGSQHAGEVWVDILGHAVRTVNITSDGLGSFPIPSGNVSIFVEQEAWSAVGYQGWDVDIYGSSYSSV